MTTPDTVVRARVSPELKREATDALAEMGLSVSDYIRMALTRVAREKAVPFPVEVPNAETRAAMAELDAGGGHRYESADAMFKYLGL